MDERMSEMRTYECWVYALECRADMVSKPEAEAVLAAQDKVIAERDKEIAKLKADYDKVRGRLQTANIINDELKQKLRNKKYKR